MSAMQLHRVVAAVQSAVVAQPDQHGGRVAPEVAEALTNVAKYAEATHATVRAALEDDALLVEVRDDGVGGANVGGGSGLSGLADRVGAVDGTLTVTSPPGEGTSVRAVLPLQLAGR